MRFAAKKEWGINVLEVSFISYHTETMERILAPDRTHQLGRLQSHVLGVTPID